ncbi:MAG TPA: TIGR00730 family Rossman fold protein [Terriglobia bacterium]|nr:TIGR00730 family Rossman fold protein [Terriglobia bacterium]
MKRICVFCGSSKGVRGTYEDSARQLGRILAARKIGLVYGGGNVGLMGVVADAVMENGGEVMGVIPQALVERELAHRTVSELIVVRSMHDRKAKMASLSDAFIALPGGFGTFEEFCEIITWAQLGMHRKPCAILNVESYYDPLLALFDRAVVEGFVYPSNRRLVLQETDPHRLLDLLAAYIPPLTEKWIDRDDS